MSRKVIKETQLATISLRFMKSLQFHSWLTLFTAFSVVKIMMTKMATKNYLPLTDIDPLLHYNIGWQPEEELLLHSKEVFEDSHSVMWQLSQAQKGKQKHQQQVGIRDKD